MSTCVRPGCRKNATYALTLERLHQPPAVLHQWLLCVDHRDAMQFEQFAATRAVETKPATRRPRTRHTTPSETTPSETQTAQAALDREDQELRARSTAEEAMTRAAATSNEEPKPEPPDGLVTKRGRPVASPAAVS